ncbi:helix-turn-helix domain-containing protein [Streptomyces sp. NPDC003877]
MTVRADVAELLRAGYGDRTIARRLGVSERRVRRARAELGLPAGRPGLKATDTIEDRFWRRAQPTDDGHLLWPAYAAHYGAVIKHDGGKQSVHRVAFRIGNGREPQGHVTSGCGRTGCVHPRHVEDQAMRNQYNAIFGAAS